MVSSPPTPCGQRLGADHARAKLARCSPSSRRQPAVDARFAELAITPKPTQLPFSCTCLRQLPKAQDNKHQAEHLVVVLVPRGELVDALLQRRGGPVPQLLASQGHI